MLFLKSTPVLALGAIFALVPASSAATCDWTWTPNNLYHDWEVNAPGVPNIPNVCGRLWNTLGCPVPSRTSCENTGNGNLRWKLTAGIGCNSGDVEAAWWRATQNRWGAIAC